MDIKKTILYTLGEVYYALKGGSAWDYYFAGELQSTNKGLEMFKAGKTAVSKRVQ